MAFVAFSCVRSKTLLAVTKLRSGASLGTSSTSGCYPIFVARTPDFLTMQKKKTLTKNISIRLIFSIADLQSAEDFDPAEDGEGASAESGEQSYPLRCSLTIDKVCMQTCLLSLLQPSLTCRFD
jgi:hypothetical protein